MWPKKPLAGHCRRASLQAIKDKAKRLLKAVQAGEASERVAPYFDAHSAFSLQRAQLVVAREYGFGSWRRLKAFVELLDQLQELAPEEVQTASAHCSFCKKPRQEVSKLICGSNSTICNECVEVCVDVLKDAGAPIRRGGDVLAGASPPSG